MNAGVRVPVAGWGEAPGLRPAVINVGALWRQLAEKAEARSKS